MSSTETSQPIRVVVAGPDGRMGGAMMSELPKHAGLTVVGSLRRTDDPAAVTRTLAGADVMVEFTSPGAALGIILKAIDAGVRPVSGATSLAEDDLRKIDEAARRRGIGAIWAPNLPLMNVLFFHFAQIAGKYASSAEIIDMHDATWPVAPVWGAREVARLIREAHGTSLDDPSVPSETIAGVRGGSHEGVRIHSMRPPDLKPVGRVEVVFAGDEEMLTIRREYWGHKAHGVSVANAVRKVMEPSVVGLLTGYAAVLGLSD